jgi:poly-beta-hydroxybutyrate-responsive repressor
VRRLLQPALLLELHRGPSHGYALLDGLDAFDLGGADPSMVYRALREMEVEGWVTSSWDPHQTQGPPRRVYSLTRKGEEVLVQWTSDLEHWRSRIDRFLRAYKRRTGNVDANR